MRPIVNMSEEDRETDIGNMHKKFGKDCACGPRDILAKGQTDRHADILITVLCNHPRRWSNYISHNVTTTWQTCCKPHPTYSWLYYCTTQRLHQYTSTTWLPVLLDHQYYLHDYQYFTLPVLHDYQYYTTTSTTWSLLLECHTTRLSVLHHYQYHMTTSTTWLLLQYCLS